MRTVTPHFAARANRWFGLLIAATLVSLLVTSPAAAFTYEFWGISGALDMTLGYALGIRTESGKTSDPDRPNSKAEHTYDDVGVFSNVFKVIAEFDAAWRNYGVVANASYSYDTMIMNQGTDRKGEPFPIDTGLGNDWADEAEDASGSVFTLLDAYGYATFWEDRLELRVGSQVINWGEGLFFLDGVAVQSTFNINKAVLPGTELKEIFLGLPAVYAQLAATENLSLEAYYQWGWEKAEFPGVGTFYGDNLLGPGGVEEWKDYWKVLGFPTKQPRVRGVDDEPSDLGQWGVAARYFVGDVELGLYYSHYHDKFPLLRFKFRETSPVGFTVRQTYLEDSDMFGASFATTLGDWSFNGEVAYQPDRRVSTNFANGDINPNGKAWVEKDTINASIHGLWIGGPLFLGIDSQFIALQIGMDYIPGGGTDRLAPQLDLNLDPTKTADNTAFGVAAEWDGTWQAVVPNVDVTLLLFTQYDFAGNSHIWGNFAEGRWLSSATVNVIIGSAWETGVTYAFKEYDDSTIDNQDSINFFVNYKF